MCAIIVVINFSVSSDSSSGSLSSIIIGAAIGVAVFIIAVVAIILVIIFCVRRSQLKKANLLNYSRVLSQGTVEVLYISFLLYMCILHMTIPSVNATTTACSCTVFVC